MKRQLLLLFMILNLGLGAQVITGGGQPGSSTPSAIDTAKFGYIAYYPNSKAVHELGNQTPDGLKDGDWYTFYPDGRLQQEAHYEWGTRSGRWVSYDKRGKTADIVNYGDQGDPELRREHRREVAGEVLVGVATVVVRVFLEVGLCILLGAAK